MRSATGFACFETAKAAFREKGSGASLDEIARTTGVGIGTLYRHFPTRDALIEAVYHNETHHLARSRDKAGRNRVLPSRPCANGCCCSSTTSQPSR